jgi:hypothetical protein
MKFPKPTKIPKINKNLFSLKKNAGNAIYPFFHRFLFFPCFLNSEKNTRPHLNKGKIEKSSTPLDNQ